MAAEDPRLSIYIISTTCSRKLNKKNLNLPSHTNTTALVPNKLHRLQKVNLFHHRTALGQSRQVVRRYLPLAIN